MNFYIFSINHEKMVNLYLIIIVFINFEIEYVIILIRLIVSSIICNYIFNF